MTDDSKRGFGFGFAPIKGEGEVFPDHDPSAKPSFDWVELVPEWLGRRIGRIAGRIYRRFDIYGA